MIKPTGMSPDLQQVALQFGMAWAQPSAENLGNLLHKDVLLKQPGLSPIKGRASSIVHFKKLFNFLPGLYGNVQRCIGENDVIFIEWKMILEYKKETVIIPIVDRLTIKDGLIYERMAYFDRSKLVRMILCSPLLWLKYFKYIQSK